MRVLKIRKVQTIENIGEFLKERIDFEFKMDEIKAIINELISQREVVRDLYRTSCFKLKT
jgi:predicted metal-dependent enzyme (double-stranded beta helix superfamily)